MIFTIEWSQHRGSNKAKMAFQYKFLSAPDDVLKCSICLEVARYPKQEEECGKLLCRECIRQWEQSCPCCRTDEPRYFKDKKSEFFLSLSLGVTAVLSRNKM